MGSNVLTYRNNWLSFFTGCVLWLAIYVQVWMDLFHMEFEVAALDAAISTLLLIFLVFIITNILRFYQPPINRELLALGGAALGGWAYQVSSQNMLEALHPVYLRLTDLSWFRFSIGFLVVLATFIISMLWRYVGEFKKASERKEDSERIAREAELFKLRHQLQPHFLFNSLNSINALIRTNSEEARRMVQQLSEFLRGTLKQEEGKFIPLGDEIAYLQLYLNIEKVRFGNRLQTFTEVGPEEAKVDVPPMLLQPLMENAIKFGLYGTTENVAIRLHAYWNGQLLHIEITNPVDRESKGLAGTGFGLKAIRRRLFLIYNRNDLLETVSDGSTFKAVLKIPVR